MTKGHLTAASLLPKSVFLSLVKHLLGLVALIGLHNEKCSGLDRAVLCAMPFILARWRDLCTISTC